MCWICTLSTMNTSSLFDEPCTCNVGCCITCVPPTSGVFVVTPGISWPTANGSLPVGIVSSRSRLITDCETELCTSTSGDAPVTVIDSSSWPIESSALTVAVNVTGRVMPSRLTLRNPVSVNATVYSPGRRSAILYVPALSVTALRDPSMSAELDASTVTPGSTAPDASFTTPAMVPLEPCAHAAADTSTRQLDMTKRG